MSREQECKGRKRKKIGFDSPFATRLRKLLSETNTTLPMLAAAIGVSRQAVEQWKNGNTVPDVLDFQKIADYFNVSMEYLAGRSKNKTNDLIHSKWEICSDGYYPYCKNCHYEPPRQESMTKYCPNCGARMDGDKHKPLHNN